MTKEQQIPAAVLRRDEEGAAVEENVAALTALLKDT